MINRYFFRIFISNKLKSKKTENFTYLILVLLMCVGITKFSNKKLPTKEIYETPQVGNSYKQPNTSKSQTCQKRARIIRALFPLTL